MDTEDASTSHRETMVVGAGAAALAAAQELTVSGRRPYLLDRGLSLKSHESRFRRYAFDSACLRIMTRDPAMKRFVSEITGVEPTLVRPSPAVLHDGRLHGHPPSILSLAGEIPPLDWIRLVGSGLKARLRRVSDDSYESLAVRRYGRRLFSAFIKTYTEKVAGLPCAALSRDWAGSPDAMPFAKAEEAWTPSQGSLAFFSRLRDRISQGGARLRPDEEIVRIRRLPTGGLAVLARGPRGDEERLIEKLFWAAPLAILVDRIDPAPPPDVVAAARSLKYRNSLVVNLIMRREHLFKEQWVYVASPAVRLARIQNLKRWAPDSVPDPRVTTLGLEYFASPDDAFWQMPDGEVIAWATSDLERLGRLGSPRDIEEAFVSRFPAALPVLDRGYRSRRDVVLRWCAGVPGLVLTGGLAQFEAWDAAADVTMGHQGVRQALSGFAADRP